MNASIVLLTSTPSNKSFDFKQNQNNRQNTCFANNAVNSVIKFNWLTVNQFVFIQNTISQTNHKWVGM